VVDIGVWRDSHKPAGCICGWIVVQLWFPFLCVVMKTRERAHNFGFVRLHLASFIGAIGYAA
jgi:hypothetical protein